MGNRFYLAWQYLRHHRLTAVVLIASITLILYLPAALYVITANAEEHFRARADSTPLLVGPKGSPLELVLGNVYFDRPYEPVLRYEELDRVKRELLGQPIPLHVRFQARDYPIVGTTKDYIALRDLTLSQGEMWGMLGECILGARVADQLQLTVGDKIPVSTNTPFTLNNPPLRLNVVGVLALSETPDDAAIFVSLSTAWILEGLGHGHDPDAKHGSSEAVLYTDITKENVHRFHFHGRRNTFPITGIIITPISERAETLLLGKYLAPEDTAQIVRPREVMDALLERVVMVGSYMIAIIAVVSLVTLLTMSMVIVLSIRLRRAEIETMAKLGCSRFTMTSILGSQIAILLLASLAIAAGLVLITDIYGAEIARMLIL